MKGEVRENGGPPRIYITGESAIQNSAIDTLLECAGKGQAVTFTREGEAAVLTVRSGVKAAEQMEGENT